MAISSDEISTTTKQIQQWAEIQEIEISYSKIKRRQSTYLRANEINRRVIYDLDLKVEWVNLINSMNLEECLFNDFDSTIDYINSNFPVNFAETLSELACAINEHNSEREEDENLPAVNCKSVVRFLYITPTLERYSPSVAVDPISGFLSITISKERDCIFTATVADDERIPYSLAVKGKRISNITGCAKFKSDLDHLNFIRALRSIWI